MYPNRPSANYTPYWEQEVECPKCEKEMVVKGCTEYDSLYGGWSEPGFEEIVEQECECEFTPAEEKELVTFAFECLVDSIANRY